MVVGKISIVACCILAFAASPMEDPKAKARKAVEARAQAALAGGRKASGDERRGLLEKAVEFYSRLISQDEKQASYRRGRAQSYVLLDNSAAALRDYAQAVHLSPKDAGLLAERGQYLFSVGQPTYGKADLEAAIALEPKVSSWRCALGRAYAELYKTSSNEADLKRSQDALDAGMKLAKTDAERAACR